MNATETGRRSASSSMPWQRMRQASLGAKLVFFSTLVTAVAVLAAFAILSLSVKRHNRNWIAGALARHQEALSNLELGRLGDLVRTSTLMTDSPTLRAAIETFAAESGPSSDTRPDLLATIQEEADRVSTALGRDLLVVTDRHGSVLAVSGENRQLARVGENLSVHPLVRHALVQDGPVGPENFAVLERAGTYFRVGSVPIVFENAIIGTLTLGDRIDDGFARRLARSFDCEVAILDGQHVVASTVAGGLDPEALARASSAATSPTEPPPLVRLLGEDYVVASRSLGRAERERKVEAYLLSSLRRYAGDANRYLLWILLAGGGWSMLVAGTAAWWVSRSLLRPLDRFVGFMRSVAVSGDHDRRFDGPLHCVEVQTLNEAYDRLVDSLLEHERRMLQGARDELSRLERLKETEKLAALGRTLSGTAHEINNPLTGVLGNVELLLRESASSELAQPKLERIKREAERIATLVRNILKISHRDTGEVSLIDVRSVLEEAVEMRRHDFASAGWTLELATGSEPLRVAGNELELHQVFLNLINNAYDAMRERDSSGCLKIEASAEDGRVAIRVADDGPGMAEPHRVFDHFYTTKPVGRGTGLGLGICRAIVQRHGGRITAENRREGGARFTVELPLTKDRIAAAEPHRERSDAPYEGLLEASVLVVDDEPAIVELQREILESLGAEVVGVGSGSEAIGLLTERDFDIIVSDFKMPGTVSGRELLRWIEAHRPEATRSFIFVTGDTAGDDGRSLAEGLGVRCLLKPFSMAEYTLTLREVHGIANGRSVRPRSRVASSILVLAALGFATAAPAADWREHVLVHGLQDLELHDSDEGSRLLSVNEDEPAGAGLLRLWVAAEPTPWLQAWVGGRFEAGRASAAGEADASIEQAFLRARLPWRGRQLTIEAGRVLVPFGSFSGRHLSSVNPLVGAPDAYGVDYPLGFVISGAVSRFDFTAAALDRPLVNERYVPELSRELRPGVELGYTPVIGVRIAGYSTRGPYLDDHPSLSWPVGADASDFDQRLSGIQLELSRGYFELHGEVAWSSYEVPTLPGRARGLAWFVEPKYTWTPRWFTALRIEENDYPFIAHTGSGYWIAPEATFMDVEAGVGWRWTADLTLKTSYRTDHWSVDSARRPMFPDGSRLAFQVSYEFDALGWVAPD